MVIVINNKRSLSRITDITEDLLCFSSAVQFVAITSLQPCRKDLGENCSSLETFKEGVEYFR